MRIRGHATGAADCYRGSQNRLGGYGEKQKQYALLARFMAKSLGQIHTVNLEIAPATDGQKFLLDAPQLLSDQLQHLVRQGNYFKTVGIDMTAHGLNNLDGGQLSGNILYRAPTKGRCQAYRAGFHAMANAFKTQGINMRDNSQYDFRCMPGGTMVNVADIVNRATLNGIDTLSLGGAAPESLFAVHNQSVTPVQTTTPTFGQGFGVYGSSTDFVHNEGILWSGNSDFADDSFESIPFTLSWDPTIDGSQPTNFQWRPDPALYLAVLAGQYVIEFETVDLDGGGGAIIVEIGVHIAGWKSIMSSPDTKSKQLSSNKSSRSGHKA